MNKLVPFLVLLVAVSAIAYLTLKDGSGAKIGAPLDPPRFDGQDLGLSTTALLEDGLTAPELTSGEDATAAPSEQRRPTTLAGELRGTVIFPESLPEDEELTLKVRIQDPPGTSAEEPVGNSTREALDYWSETIELAPDGSFQFSYPAGTELLAFELEARYLYLSKTLEVVPSRHRERPLEIHPKLGAWITGSVQLPESGFGTKFLGPRDEVELAPPLDLEGSRPFGEAPEFTARSQFFDGENNRFSFGGVPPIGRAQVRVLPTTFAAATEPEFPLRAGDHVDLQFALELGCSVSGRVLDLEDNPVAGVAITVERDAQVFGRGGWAARSGETDENGRFNLNAISSGPCWITFEKNGFLDSIERFTLLPNEQRSGVEVNLDSGRFIAGRVAWPDSSPAIGAEVEVDFDPAFLSGLGAFNAINGRSGMGQTDEQGSFRINGLGAGPFVVKVTARPEEADDSEPLWVGQASAVRPGDVIQLQLSEPLGVRGQLQDDLGQPIPAFTVIARRSSGPGLIPGLGLESVTGDFEDENGEFFLKGLREGDWELIAKAEGHGIAEPLKVHFPLESEAPIALRLDRGGVVHGIVLDSSGEPAGDAYVSLNWGLDNMARLAEFDLEFGASTNEAGRFLLMGMPTGPQELVATAEGFGASEPLAIDLAPGEEQSAIVLELSVGGSIAGTLYGEEGDPNPGRIIMVQSTLGLGVPLRSTTDSNGEFLFEHLRPGSYQVVSVFGTDQGLEGDGESEVEQMISNMKFEVCEVLEGETTLVSLGIQPLDPVLVTGRISSGDQPVSDIAVSFLPSGDAEDVRGLAFAAVDKEGFYKLELDGPGSYIAYIQTLTGGLDQQSVEFQCEVPDWPEHTLDFELPTAGISGTVFDSAGDPVAQARVTLSIDGPISSGVFTGGNYGEITTGADGSYRFDWLRPNTYMLAAGGTPLSGLLGELVGEGLGRTILPGVVVEENQVITGLDFRLKQAGTIEGLVLDSSGSPVRGATIFVRDHESNPIERISFISTDAGGKFTAPGLAAGSYEVSARTREEVDASPTVVEVSSGQTSKVELKLQSGTRMLVTMIDREGQPVRCELEVLDRDGRQVNGLFSYAELSSKITGSSTLSNSEVEIGPLPAGRYSLHATAKGGLDAKKKITLNGQAQRRVKLRLD